MTKKYTLYFKGKNKYGHEHNFPIVSLGLKDIDMYTSYYKNYVELFLCLPKEVHDFIKNELGYNIDFNNNADLEKCFYVTDNDFTPIMDVIFEDDKDILYIEAKELQELLVSKSMSFEEFQKALLKTYSLSNIKKYYNFFAYLYNTYVKDEKIKCMIDDYDVRKKSFDLDEDNVMIASIATDKDNLIILSKKLSQTLESRRSLAFELKKAFDHNNLIPEEKVKIRSDEVDMAMVTSKMISNLRKFQKKYDDEYEKNV